jgi:ribosomal protein S18 acetylase RimI-like enzyme
MFMKSSNLEKLNNPVWNSLYERHQSFVIDYPAIKFYNPDYCPFGGFQKGEDISTDIDEYATRVNNFFIVGEKPEISTNLKIKNELVCLQMIIHERSNVAVNEEIVKLTTNHAEALYQLINLVQPGYFKMKTALLGDYFGIFKKGVLVAVTGERMKMNDFTEVSAVVTHPDHTGRGYAKQLVAHTVNNILDQDRIPYLHVVESNTGAIKLYENLGFTINQKISFWNIVSNGF